MFTVPASRIGLVLSVPVHLMRYIAFNTSTFESCSDKQSRTLWIAINHDAFGFRRCTWNHSAGTHRWPTTLTMRFPFTIAAAALSSVQAVPVSSRMPCFTLQ
jgi:hypothetical protein